MVKEFSRKTASIIVPLLRFEWSLAAYTAAETPIASQWAIQSQKIARFRGGLHIAYLCTKFDNSSFSRFRDTVGANQNLNGSRDLTTSLSEMVATINLSTKFEVSIFTHYQNVKGDIEC